MVTCLSILYIRSWYIGDIGDLIINDDGHHFLNLAEFKGWESFFYTVGGYFHVIIRIISLAVTFFPLELQPFILLLAVLIVYSISVLILVITYKSLEINNIIIYLSVLLLFLIPSDDYIYLNMSNSQWFLGTAYIIYLLAYQRHSNHILNYIFIFICGLSGTYSIFVFPALLIKSFFIKNNTYNNITFTVFCSAIIQIISVISFQNGMEPNNTPFDIEYAVKLGGYIFYSFFYNFDNIYTNMSLFVIISISSYCLIKNTSSKKNILMQQNYIFLLFIITTIAILGGTYIRNLQGHASFFNPIKDSLYNHNRYMFIPHYLFISGIVILTHRYIKLCLIALICFFIISLIHIGFIKRERTYIYSFINFSNYQPVYAFNNYLGNARVPVSIWFTILRRDHYQVLADERKKHVTEGALVSENAQIKYDNGIFNILWGENGKTDPAIIKFSDPIQCADTKDIAMDFKISSSVPVRLIFSLNPYIHGQEKQSSTISFFPGIINETQYVAFPHIKEKAELTLSLVPYPQSGETSFDKIETKIDSLNLYCLPPPPQ